MSHTLMCFVHDGLDVLTSGSSKEPPRPQPQHTGRNYFHDGADMLFHAPVGDSLYPMIGTPGCIFCGCGGGQHYGSCVGADLKVRRQGRDIMVSRDGVRWHKVGATASGADTTSPAAPATTDTKRQAMVFLGGSVALAVGLVGLKVAWDGYHAYRGTPSRRPEPLPDRRPQAKYSSGRENWQPEPWYAPKQVNVLYGPAIARAKAKTAA